MDANEVPDGEGEVGSNDEEMPQLKASVVVANAEDEDEFEQGEEDGSEPDDDIAVAADLDDTGQEEPLLSQQTHATEKDDADLEEEVEEEEEEGVEGVEEEPEGDEVEGDVEMETEEGDEDYENTGNPGAPRDQTDDSNNEDPSEEENVRKTRFVSSVKQSQSEMQANNNNKEDNTVMTRKRSASISSSEEGPKRKQVRSGSTAGGEQQQQKGTASSLDGTHDKYCWVCHKDGVYFNCKICPRSYHMRCICLPEYPEPTLPEGEESSKVCICPECVVVMNAEEVEKRSEAMKQLSMDQLINLLKQICGRMKLTPGAEPFLKPVQVSDVGDYYDFIVYPMDIQTLEKNIKQRQYGSTEAFLADAQWIVHNSIIFNSSSSPYTASAKRILKVCKQELSEIETCPECYTNAHTKSDTWFVEACRRPHILVWAKLKGFPFWPAKAMKIKDDQVDVRFFGQHDRAWVNLKDCFLYSEEMPAAPPKKNTALLSAIEELNTHIAKLEEAHGEILLAKAKTPLGRELSTSEIQRFLPNFKPEETVAKRGTSGEKDKPKVSITISSIKTNPTIVNNSLSESPPPANSSDKKLGDKKTKRGSVAAVDSATGPSRVTRSSNTVVTAKEEDSPTPPALEDSTVESLPVDSAELEKESPEPTKEEDSLPAIEPEPPKKDLDDFESRVPSGEILASALGLKRITRKASHNDSSSVTMTPVTAKVQEMDTTPTNNVEKRTSRSTNSSNNEEDAEGVGNGSSLVAQQLKKSARVSTVPADVQETSVQIKTEPIDPVENNASDTGDGEQEELEDKVLEQPLSLTRSKAHDFMEHISTQAQTNPGYRFNISKDISISAIGQESPDPAEDNANVRGGRKIFGLGQSVSINHAGGGSVSVQRPSLSVQPTTKQNFPTNQLQGNLRPRLSQSLPAQQQQQPLQTQPISRFLHANKDIRSLTRMLKPAMSPSNAKSSVPAVGATRPPNRAVPGAIQMSNIRGGNQALLQKLAKDGSFKQQPIVVDSTSLRVDNLNQYGVNAGNPLQKMGSASSTIQNQVQTVQGPITLPGGTITVTPLSHQGGSNTNSYASGVSVNGDRSLKPGGNIQSSSSSKIYTNGLPISIVESNSTNSNSPAVTATPVLKSSGKVINAQLARKMTNMVPPSVVATVQGLQKNVNELIRVAAEAIAVDMVEHAVSKTEEVKSTKLETDKLQQKHMKELTDLRLNHELMMRELRSNMDSDKKRAMNDLRRQLEMEKQKAVEDAKKKQWCAQCLREALFYCCWNTSYCGYTCQEDHWPTHMATCTQNAAGNTSGLSGNVSSR